MSKKAWSERKPSLLNGPGRSEAERRSRTARSALGTIANIVSSGARSATGPKNNIRDRAGSSSGSRRLGVHKRRVQLTTEQQAEARVRRFAMQSTAARVLPGERVAHCLRRRVPVAKSVDVQYVQETHSAHYRGLQTCSSVWHCPMCAALISEKRRDELSELVKAHVKAGGSVYMTTYTIKHSRYDDLAALLSRFLAARRRMRQGRQGVALRKDFQVIGTVSVLEVTWSEVNGWHPHVHELVFSSRAEMDVTGYGATARAAWERAAAAEGLSMNDHGFEIQRTYGAVADYIAKYGREPAIENVWGVEAEMTKGHIKQGRGTEEHYTPFALLAAIHDGEEGSELLAGKFAEYARVFKGRKQLTYSPGLKARYQVEEKTDEDLMAEHEHEAMTLVELQDEQWSGVLANDARAEVLEEARTGRPGRVLSLLTGLGIATYREQYERFVGWRVSSPSGAATVERVTWCPILNRWRCSVKLDQAGDDGATWRAFDLDDLQVTLAPDCSAGPCSLESDPGDHFVRRGPERG